MRRLLLCLFGCAAALSSTALGQEPSDQAASEAAIRKAAASYAEAFNKHDAKAVADHWSPEAVYHQPHHGRRGRRAGRHRRTI